MSGVTYKSSDTRQKFQQYVAEVMDENIKARTQRVLDMAKTDNFGFTDRSHRLRDSIRMVKARNPKVASYKVIAGEGVFPMAMTPKGLKPRSDKSYAHAVEVGTPTSDPHPYLQPALQAARDE
jgi:hypothetical protein